MTTTDDQPCWVCRADLMSGVPLTDGDQYDCSGHGRYQVTGSVLALGDVPPLETRERALENERAKQGDNPKITSYSL